MQLSPDGNWQWNEASQQWEPAARADPAQVVPGSLSPDGRYRWDGAAWVPVEAPVPAMSAPPAAKRPMSRGKKVLIGGAAGLVVLTGIGLAAGGGESSTSGAGPAATAEATEQATADGAPEAADPAESAPEESPTVKPPSDKAALRSAIREAIGSPEDRPEASVGWSKSDKTLYVEFAVSDNLSSGMIRSGAEMDVADILKAAQASPYAKKADVIEIVGTFPMQNSLGEDLGEVTAMRATFSGSDVRRMQFENLTSEDVVANAQDLWWHQAMQ